MIIKTKKYALPPRTYIKLAFLRRLRAKWWVPLVLVLASAPLFYFSWKKLGMLSVVGSVLYVGFLFVQVYGSTLIEQNKNFFMPFAYQISSKEIVLQVNKKQGMVVPWKHIKEVQQHRTYFLFVMGPIEFFYLPYKIFYTSQQVKFVKMLLKRKNLLR